MADGFPYFKFIATEWLTGDIVFEDFELQGIFINVCAIYWHRNGNVSFDEITKRLKTDRLSELTPRFFSVNEGFLSIKFLDEQLVAANHISKTNSQNGKKGGRPTKDKNRPLSETKPKKSKEEKEEEIKESKYTLSYFENQGYNFGLSEKGREAIDSYLKYRELHPQHGAVKSAEQIEGIIMAFKDRKYSEEQVIAAINKTKANGAKNIIMDEIGRVQQPKKTPVSKPHPDLPDDWWTAKLTEEQVKLIPSSVNAARIIAQGANSRKYIGI